MRKMRNGFLFCFLLLVLSFPNMVSAAEVCPLGPEVTKDLYGVLKIIRIVAPILVIALSTWDALKAITKGEANTELKKVAIRFGKRAIYAIILFFIPVLVDQAMQMMDVWDANGTCNFELEAKKDGCNAFTYVNCPVKAPNGDQCQRNGDEENGSCNAVATVTRPNNGSTTTSIATTTTTTNPAVNNGCSAYAASGCPIQAPNGERCERVGEGANVRCQEKREEGTERARGCSSFSAEECPLPPATAPNGNSCEVIGSGATARCSQKLILN